MKLRVGYLLSGITTGFILLCSFIWTLPDGKLHIIFCDVGQGDAAYVRFPDGRDMVVDGGPNDRVMDCLGRHMPFWDRHLDMVVMTHPQKDHMHGLIALMDRFSVGYFLRSDVSNTTEGYQKLVDVVKKNNISVKYLVQGDQITIGSTSLSLLWPSSQQIAEGVRASDVAQTGSQVLGAATGDLNDYSLVFTLQYGDFDAVFTGDADSRVEPEYVGLSALKYPVEVLKVPHHGSKTGMTDAFIGWVKPELAVISVGKNSYGHPSKQAVDMLQSVNSQVLRTDQQGDIEVVSDGKQWSVTEDKMINKKN
jgi:competence protein ComEC